MNIWNYEIDDSNNNNEQTDSSIEGYNPLTILIIGIGLYIILIRRIKRRVKKLENSN